MLLLKQENFLSVKDILNLDKKIFFLAQEKIPCHIARGVFLI